MITKPIRFRGNNLELNFSASAAGSVRVELLHGQVDKAIDGLAWTTVSSFWVMTWIGLCAGHRAPMSAISVVKSCACASC